MKRIEFFYDIVSPYSYLAFETLVRYRPIWDLDLQLRPFLLGGVMQATGNRPPASLPAKAVYMARDLGRNVEYFGVKLQIPDNFPVLTLKAQRLLTAAQADHPHHLEALSRRLWQLYWSENGDVTQEGVLLGACRHIGLDESAAQALVSRTEDPVIKEALKATTAEAVSRGAFGAPTFFVQTAQGGTEMFFGSDRFPVVAMQMGVEWRGPRPTTD